MQTKTVVSLLALTCDINPKLKQISYYEDNRTMANDKILVC